MITIRPRAQYEALQAARTRQARTDFAAAYRQPAGIEGKISQGLRRCDVRHAGYVGLAKTRLQHLGSAAAINLRRMSGWLEERPRAQTRQSAFERLYHMAA
jgi:transposase